MACNMCDVEYVIGCLVCEVGCEGCYVGRGEVGYDVCVPGCNLGYDVCV